MEGVFRVFVFVSIEQVTECQVFLCAKRATTISTRATIISSMVEGDQELFSMLLRIFLYRMRTQG